MTEQIYRGMTRDELDAAYNNGRAVADSAQRNEAFLARSAAYRATAPCTLDIAYGPGERNVLDYFPADRPGPIVLFLHGGYWQMRSKEYFSFVAEGLTQRGVHVALAGYTLCPPNTVGGIVSEIHQAIDTLVTVGPGFGGDVDRLVTTGWSAGGHLTALSQTHPRVRGGVTMSGIFDLEPIRLNYLNDKLQLTEADVVSLSPVHRLSELTTPLVVCCGGEELPELIRQSTTFAQARHAQGLPGELRVLPGHNHFSILEELASPTGVVANALVELVTPAQG